MMHGRVNSIASALLDGLFPQVCALCGLRSQRDLPLCAGCEGDLSANSSCCPRCALPLPPPPATGIRPCGACLRHPPPFHRTVAPWLYDEYWGHLIQRWKFGGERRLTTLFTALWLARQPHMPAIDLLLPVPLHWRRRWQRGFNQAELLCLGLRQQCPQLARTPIALRLARRNRNTAAQSLLGTAQRGGNLRGAFTVRGRCDNLRVAIVDDVVTTGATAASLAEAVAAAGARHIEVWCLARTPPPGG